MIDEVITNKTENIHRQASEYFDKDFNNFYQIFIEQTLMEVKSTLIKQGSLVRANLNKNFLPLLAKELENRLEKELAESPGRGKLGVERKQEQAASKVIDIENRFLQNYFGNLTRNICEELNRTISTYTSKEYSNDNFLCTNPC